MTRIVFSFGSCFVILACGAAPRASGAPAASLDSCMAPAALSQVAARDSGNTLQGRVCVEETGRPEPNVLIVIALKGHDLRAATDSNGQYVLRGLPLGEFTVQVRGVGYYLESRQVEFGGCGVRLVDSTGKVIDTGHDNPVTCRAEQWLAFSVRSRPVY